MWKAALLQPQTAVCTVPPPQDLGGDWGLTGEYQTHHESPNQTRVLNGRWAQGKCDSPLCKDCPGISLPNDPSLSTAG